MKKVSVIVPFYNVENYLSRCLDSLLNQTSGDFEVVMIDDGSADKSHQIAAGYAETDSRFALYQKENGGEASARNLGIEKSAGEYIMFLDADDFYEPETIEKALTAIESLGCGIVEFGIKYIDENGSLLENFIPPHSGKLSLFEHPELLMGIKNCAWDKIYRKSLFTEHDVHYQTGYYTDFGTTFRIIVFADEIGFVQESLINYFVGRSGSISTQFSRKCFAIFDMIDSIVDHYKQNGLYERFSEEIKAQAILNIVDIMRLAVASDNKPLRDEFLDKSFRYLRGNFGDMKSKYKLRFYRSDFLYFHPFLLKLYLLLKGRL